MQSSLIAHHYTGGFKQNIEDLKLVRPTGFEPMTEAAIQVGQTLHGGCQEFAGPAVEFMQGGEGCLKAWGRISAQHFIACRRREAQITCPAFDQK